MVPLPAGVWPAIISPLTQGLEPNLTELDKLVEALIDDGADGFYLLGSTGQGPALSLAARQQIAERVLQQLNGRVPVMVHVGAVATADAITLARHAAEHGAAAVSSVPPFYPPAPGDVAMQHYSDIATATDLPFYCYYLSALSGAISGSIADHVRRLQEIPHMAGMKYTGHDMYTLGRLCDVDPDGFRVYSGADELFAQSAMSGACGAIGSTYNVWGTACRRARARCIEGDFASTKAFMATFQRVIDELLQGGFYAFMRMALRKKYGVEIGPARLPHFASAGQWDEARVETLIALVDEA